MFPLITLPYLPLSRLFQSAISFHKFLVAGTNWFWIWLEYRIQFYRSFYFTIRFIWSMLSYGSGLPGGNFLAHSSFRISFRRDRWNFPPKHWLYLSKSITLFIILGNEWVFWGYFESSFNRYDFGNRDGR